MRSWGKSEAERKGISVDLIRYDTGTLTVDTDCTIIDSYMIKAQMDSIAEKYPSVKTACQK